jgi:uncharacterized protein (TIGR02265 family)
LSILSASHHRSTGAVKHRYHALMSERLVFKPAVQALLINGLADCMTPEVRGQLHALGFDFDKLLPGYPYPLWERAIDLVTTTLFPDLERPEAQSELGRRLAIASAEANPVSKRLLPLMRLMGVSRAVKRALSHTTEVNFNVVSFSDESAGSLTVHMSDVGAIPHFARGSIIGLGELLGTPLRAQLLRFDAPQATYVVEWG